MSWALLLSKLHESIVVQCAWTNMCRWDRSKPLAVSNCIRSKTYYLYEHCPSAIECIPPSKARFSTHTKAQRTKQIVINVHSLDRWTRMYCLFFSCCRSHRRIILCCSIFGEKFPFSALFCVTLSLLPFRMKTSNVNVENKTRKIGKNSISSRSSSK